MTQMLKARDDDFAALTGHRFSLLTAAVIGFLCTDIACAVAMLLRM